ncbi:MAG TPA: hypothetical protein VFH78_10040 [Candidatus Thermoplasmatota archaeon]|nr:hypothetical protein [Candidatus Thermoplasmatota archaeon]
MVDWQALEGIGGVATAVAVVVALVLGLVQVRHMAAQRREVAVFEALRQMLAPEFVAAVDRILQLPDDAAPDAIARDADTRRAIVQAYFVFEMAGMMVHDRIIPLHDADRIFGGMLRTCWRKVRRYSEAERQRLGSPSVAEWFQWLYERMEADPAPGKREGAHVAFRHWSR